MVSASKRPRRGTAGHRKSRRIQDKEDPNDPSVLFVAEVTTGGSAGPSNGAAGPARTALAEDLAHEQQVRERNAMPIKAYPQPSAGEFQDRAKGRVYCPYCNYPGHYNCTACNKLACEGGVNLEGAPAGTRCDIKAPRYCARCCKPLECTDYLRRAHAEAVQLLGRPQPLELPPGPSMTRLAHILVRSGVAKVKEIGAYIADCDDKATGNPHRYCSHGGWGGGPEDKPPKLPFRNTVDDPIELLSDDECVRP